MSRVILKAEKLVKIYNAYQKNAFEALHGIDFEVYEGEFIGIMGPSGSGKSTFINNISTIDTPTKGNVYINGRDVRTMSQDEVGKFRYDNLGYIFQAFNLLDTHTMFENIAMPLALEELDEKQITERVNALAEKMQISQLLNKFPYECSGGQRQRGAICRALVNDPGIIIADEPTGNLDSANSSELMKIFQNMNKNEHVTIVMVTHDPLIASYSSRMIFIRDGMIEASLEKGEMDQDQYFQEIVKINSAESREIIQK